jgi:hypothetical protein
VVGAVIKRLLGLRGLATDDLQGAEPEVASR